MRNIKINLLGILAFLFLLAGCEYEGIDPITEVATGNDTIAPQVNVSYPQEGTTIKVIEEVSSINIQFKVTDDIEVDNIQVMVDGNEVATLSDFKDYRIINEEVTFENVTNGEHTVTVTATDINGKTTTVTRNFSKEPPYTPRFLAYGEYLYMPFDGDYTDLMSLRNATQVGDPGFTEDAFLGGRAYEGAEESYLTLPFDGESLGQEFTIFFWYKFNSDPNRAGIITMQPEGFDQAADSGLRLFREPNPQGVPVIKLNVGTGSTNVWNDGGTIDDYEGEWINVAVTVSTTATTIYFNGMPQKEATLEEPIDWTGADLMSIMSGAPRFTGWDHLSDESAMDELRIFSSALTQEQIQELIGASAETLYMPFDGDYKDLVTGSNATVVGDPGFADDAVAGDAAYSGASGSYLTLPAVQSQEFTATFWYKFDGSTDNAGLIAMSPVDPDHPDAPNLRTSGIRLFRELRDGVPVLKLNVGTGEGESWNDGGAIGPYEGEWVHVAFTVSSADNKTVIYIDGQPVKEGNLGGNSISWEGADLLSVMSGAPRFTGWGHLADQSDMDELRFYNKVLSPEEIAAMANNQ